MEITKGCEQLNWRKSLKPGDKFAFRSSSMSPPSIFVVVRTTKTLIVAESHHGRELRFSIQYGKMHGNKSYSTIAPVTQTVIDNHDAYEIKNWLGSIYRSTSGATANQLRAMKAAYEAAK